MKLKRSVVIDAPVDEVWAAVRRFDGVAAWNPGVKTAVMESGGPTETGSVRRLEIVDGSVFRETLLAHSDLAIPTTLLKVRYRVAITSPVTASLKLPRAIVLWAYGRESLSARCSTKRNLSD